MVQRYVSGWAGRACGISSGNCFTSATERAEARGRRPASSSSGAAAGNIVLWWMLWCVESLVML